MTEVTVRYFDRPGGSNTEETLGAAVERAQMLGIRQVVVATSHGDTGLRARALFPPEVLVVGVTISAAFSEEGWVMTADERRRLTDAGVTVLTGMHALGDDVSEAMSGSGWSPSRVARETLYRFSQGMKVAIEVTLMAAEAGLLDMDSDVIAIAGTDSGADTALVLKPAYARAFDRLKVREILAMPRC
ncbi:MAG: hypothetical protein GXX93_04235 [Anaerolineae bacterium]|nr:hypothetical protein [Anaerolineae bacterium]